MQVESLLKRALNKEFLSAEEGEFLFHNAATAELMFVGNDLKKQVWDSHREFKGTILASLGLPLRIARKRFHNIDFLDVKCLYGPTWTRKSNLGFANSILELQAILNSRSQHTVTRRQVPIVIPAPRARG